MWGNKPQEVKRRKFCVRISSLSGWKKGSPRTKRVVVAFHTQQTLPRFWKGVNQDIHIEDFIVTLEKFLTTRNLISVEKIKGLFCGFHRRHKCDLALCCFLHTIDNCADKYWFVTSKIQGERNWGCRTMSNVYPYRIHPGTRRTFLSQNWQLKLGVRLTWVRDYYIFNFYDLRPENQCESWGASFPWVRLVHGWIRYRQHDGLSDTENIFWPPSCLLFSSILYTWITIVFTTCAHRDSSLLFGIRLQLHVQTKSPNGSFWPLEIVNNWRVRSTCDVLCGTVARWLLLTICGSCCASWSTSSKCEAWLHLIVDVDNEWNSLTHIGCTDAKSIKKTSAVKYWALAKRSSVNQRDLSKWRTAEKTPSALFITPPHMKAQEIWRQQVVKVENSAAETGSLEASHLLLLKHGNNRRWFKTWSQRPPLELISEIYGVWEQLSSPRGHMDSSQHWWKHFHDKKRNASTGMQPSIVISVRKTTTKRWKIKLSAHVNRRSSILHEGKYHIEQ